MFLMTTWNSKDEAFSGRILERGTSGQDVIELQERLKYIGYLNDVTDGSFGWNTYWAVRKFQKDFGIKVDGKVGSKTQRVLVNKTKYTPTQSSTPNPANTVRTEAVPTSNFKLHGYSDNDLKLMANAVFGEARGEPFIGQVAIAAVILNRVKSASFPNTPSGVIFEPRAFTAVSDGQIWLTPNAKAKKAVQDALNGWDPTEGCTYYFNPETATSPWIWGRPQVKRIGKHIFCR
ncbi:MAG TPA: spore cortex-lytic enzyme [Bacillota bacterium]|nr:spore cortex-lytic enzyme [Bacillota bacterium]